MNKEKYIEDLSDIKNIMSKSSRFISLGGMSGIAAGVVSLIAAYAAYITVYEGQNYLGYRKVVLTDKTLITLILIAAITIILTTVLGIYFTAKSAKNNDENVWDDQVKRLVMSLAIPLVTGGLLCLILLFKGYVGMLAPLTLIFYGLGLVNASKYTHEELRSLGIIEVALGLIGMQFVGYGLLLWAEGFGILHIVYGIIMKQRYGS